MKVAYWLSFTVAEDHLSFLRGPKGSSGFTDQGPRSGWLQDLWPIFTSEPPACGREHVFRGDAVELLVAWEWSLHPGGRSHFS